MRIVRFATAAAGLALLIWGGPLLALEPTRLDSDPTVPIDEVLAFWISPDDVWAVVQGRVGNAHRLYAVSLDGETTVDIGPPAGAPGIWGIQVASDASSVHYLVRDSPLGHSELWCSPLGRSPSSGHQVSPRSPELFGVRWFELSPDASRVVFVSPIANPYSLNIWSAPACGTPETALQLEVDLHDNEHVDRFWISSDSRHVAYSSSQSPLFHSSPLHRSRPRVVSELTPYSLAFVRGGSEVVFGAYSESRHSLFIDRFPSGGGGSQCLTCDYDFDLINFLPVTGDSVVVAARPRDLVKRPEVRSLDLSTKNAVAMLVGRDLQESDHPFVVSSDHQYLMFGQFDDAGSRLALAPLAGPIDSTLSILLPYGTGLGTFEFIAPGEGGAVLHVRNEFPLGRCHRWDFESPSHLTPLSAEDLPIADLERPCQQIPNRDAILFPMGDGPGECCGFFLSHIHGPTDSNPWRLLDTGEAETPHYADPNYQLTTDGERLIFRSAIYAPDTSKAHLWSLPLPLFWDSFESGTVGHWDSAVGLQL